MTLSPPFITAASFNTDPVIAANELREQLKKPGISFIMFFCSAEYDLQQLADALNMAFGEVAVVGCTTAGEITRKDMGRDVLRRSALAKHSSRSSLPVLNAWKSSRLPMRSSWSIS